jgi:tetratricopeptide (TPR) repeat protein
MSGAWCSSISGCSMRHPVSSRRLVVLALTLAAPAAGRAQAISQGFELERQGHADQAATLYFSVLRGEPANLPALLGLERVLTPLGRIVELLPLAQRALTVDTTSGVRSVALRTYTALDMRDSAAALVRRWVAARPGDPAPWREWAIALEDHQRFEDARNVLLLGRRTLGTPAALAIELAELGQRTSDWQTAAFEWAGAAAASPSQLPNAVSQLDDAPADQRDRVIRTLTTSAATSTARRIAAELLLGWGQPDRSWDVLVGTLDPPTPEAAVALRRFAARAVGSSPGVRRVHGLALARLADLLPGALGAQARAEAARALLDAGDRQGARAILLKLAADPSAPRDALALAQLAMVEGWIADGQLDSATAGLARLDRDGAANGDDRERLRHALVAAWIRVGQLDKADQALGADSSVEAAALHGWILLYRGGLKEAIAAFRTAGPYAGDRDATTARTAMLALLAQVDIPESPELGAALLQLARGDSSGAVAALRHAADKLPSGRGRPDVLLVAGRIAARLGAGQEGTAADLFSEVVQKGGSGAAAPAAELELARILLRRSRPTDAVAHLEHLILTYPESAVVPEARRELERAKGAIPRS